MKNVIVTKFLLSQYFKTINQYLCSFEGKNVKQVLIRETKTEMTIKLSKNIKL